MTERIILAAVSILMLALALRKKDKQTVLLTFALSLGVILTLIENPILVTIGLLIYIITSLIVVIYGIKTKQLSTLEKTVIILSGIWSFYGNASSLLHLPYANELRMSTLIPIILYLILTIRGLGKKKEFGFLTILNLEFLFRFLRLWN